SQKTDIESRNAKCCPVSYKHACAMYLAQVSTEMESKNFYKLFKDAGMIDKVLTQTDCDLIFTKVKTKGARKINYSEFQTALEHIAGKKKCSVDDVAATICGAEAKINATTAQATKFHDDKSLYTGVYANGGPTNVDRQNMMAAGDLSQQLDRSAADARGVKASHK
ncbi:hypothetical protein QJQ45_013813, partial [Haematococcus lacustris]